ncbi:MAG: superinfection immunity protein [Chlorobiaceae bacterium]|nr:superinfection immunity protein [Chlorobiaceae bacterium]
MMHEWSRSWYWSDSSPALAFFLTLAFWGVYFIPSVIAFWRNHRSKAAILALNILLGWTGLGWIGAFVWSLAYTGPDRINKAFAHENPA